MRAGMNQRSCGWPRKREEEKETGERDEEFEEAAAGGSCHEEGSNWLGLEVEAAAEQVEKKQ